MKKNLFAVFLFLSGYFTLTAQVQIGTGDIKYYAPIDLRYDSTYSQTIYLKSELNATGTITSIQWYYDNTYDTSTNQVTDIYLGLTTKSDFSSNTDWIVTGLKKVYSGRFVTNGTKGWKTITLTTPFVYDGTSNIVVATNARNNTAHAPFNGIYYFLNTSMSSNRTLVTQTDGQIYNPSKPPTWSQESPNIPNIIFGGLTQACSNAIGVTASNIGTTTATISWQASTPAPALGSDYYYSPTNVEPTNNTEPSGSILSGANADISSLLPGTKYYVWVRNKCSANDYSQWSTVISFITECNGADYLFQNFDGVSSPDLPPCWKKILRGTGLSSGAVIKTFESGYVVSEPNLVELYSAESPNTADVILVSPIISNLGTGLNRLKLYLKGSADVVEIGTLDKNDNTGKFTVYKTINDVDRLWGLKEINFNNYRGTDKYIGIRVVFNPSEDWTFADVDNFLWEANPLCQDVKGIIIPATTPNSATVKWDLSIAPQYQVVYGISTNTDPNSLTPFPPTSNAQYVLTNLTPNTTYNVWVRSVCTGNIYGAWNEPVTFTTPCLPEPEMGFYEDFNQVTTPNLPNCWSKIITGPTATPFSTVDTTNDSDILPQPNIACKLYNYESVSDDYKVFLVSPKLSTLQSGTYRLKFKAKHLEYNADLEIGTLNNNTNFAEFNVIQVANVTNTTGDFTVEFSDYTGPDTFIGIRLKPSSSYCSVIIDNISWEISPVCPDVSGIIVSAPTPDGAIVSWTNNGSDESFDVSVVNSENNDPNTGEIVNTKSESITLTDLDSSTNYNVWVRSVCVETGNGSWIGPVNFTTACSPVETFEETFEDEIIPNLPACWSKILRGIALSENSDVRTTSDARMPESTKAVEMRNTSENNSADVILVTPNLSTLSSGNYRLRFKAKGDNTGVLEFGTLSSSDENAVFHPIGNPNTIVPSSTPTEYIVEFNGNYGSDTYIGIRLATILSFVELDNIIWEQIPLCPDVTNLEFLESDTNSANVIWDGGTRNIYDVAYGPISETTPNPPYTITDIPYIEIENLTPGTSYNVWVRRVCDVNLGNGAWEGPIVVTTQCNAANIPYIQNFDSAILPDMPVCTSAFNLSEGAYNWYVSSGAPASSYGFESNTLTYDSDLYNDANAWFYTQGVNLTKDENYTIFFTYGGASNDTFYYNNSLKVMYGTQASEIAMKLPLFNNPFFATDKPISESVNFKAPSSGVYYFGFNVYSPNNSNYMFIDDIKIDIALSSNKFDLTNFNYFPNPVKDVLNISTINNITAVSVYNLLGQEVITKKANENLTKIEMSGLSTGSYMVKITADNLVKTIKVIKE